MSMIKNKVVINACYVGFGLSILAEETLLKLKGIDYIREDEVKFGRPTATFYYREIKESNRYKHLAQLEWESLSLEDRTYMNTSVVDISYERHDKDLIQVVEGLGKAASGLYARLEVEEIEGSRYQIEEYDGAESVITPDEQTWTEIK